MVSSLVLTHLDYANVILAGCSHIVMKKLQRVQYMAAKVVLSKGKYGSAIKVRITLATYQSTNKIQIITIGVQIMERTRSNLSVESSL